MRKIILSLLTMLGINSLGLAQSVPVVTVKGEITSNQTWSPGQVYKLEGWVYVTDGVTLTINPGTIIKGDKNSKAALIVERGAKIMAQGTVEKPIVFTSNQPQGTRSNGDWGGVIICGKAPVNWTAGEGQIEGGVRSKYGGTDANDNSGVLSYARIEFAGIAFAPNNEINSLTLGGVGSGTKIDHVQISYAGDDGIEWFGGTVNTKHMVTVRTWDDDFDTDNQYNGKNQFMFVLRDPNIADVSGSKAFEGDSYLAGTIDGKTNNNNATKAVFSNCTVVGPLISSTSTAYNPLYVAGAHLRRGSAQSILNSVFMGWPCGLLIDEPGTAFGSTIANINDNTLQFRNNVIAGTPTMNTPNYKDVVFVRGDNARNNTPTTANNSDSAVWAGNVGPITWFKSGANMITSYAQPQNLLLQNAYDLSNPNPLPNSASPISYNSRTLPSYMTNGGTVDPFSNGRVYPFNPSKPINTDTSGLFANYNAPTLLPDFTNTRANDGFFEKVNYIGAFAGTQTTADNWMQGWTNWTPNNTNYDVVDTKVANVAASASEISIFPNPASENAFVTFDIAAPTDVVVYLSDITGKVVKNLYNGKNVNGGQMLPVDLTNVTAGTYFITITNGNFKNSAKITVAK
ncbi:MAG: T9SS type A sorting domain-containing protein [Sphingobacteriales bacterium]|nr:MAG: T9SS type A sorting domain-containing protein [Sphingobacteriales bacterium]